MSEGFFMFIVVPFVPLTLSQSIAFYFERPQLSQRILAGVNESARLRSARMADRMPD